MVGAAEGRWRGEGGVRGLEWVGVDAEGVG